MEEDYSSNESTQKVAKFNSTLAILYRIDILWKDAHHHSRNGNYNKWNFDLDRVWCELAADANEKDCEEFEKFNKEIDKIDFKKTHNPKTGEEIILNKPLLYKALIKKEIFLRKLQNKQGKGVAYEVSAEDYMD